MNISISRRFVRENVIKQVVLSQKVTEPSTISSDICVLQKWSHYVLDYIHVLVKESRVILYVWTEGYFYWSETAGLNVSGVSLH